MSTSNEGDHITDILRHAKEARNYAYQTPKGDGDHEYYQSRSLSPMFKNQTERDQAIRQYAAGKLSLAILQKQGLDNFLFVLQRLGALGPRPPTAPMDGPNAEMRAKGRALIAKRIRAV